MASTQHELLKSISQKTFKVNQHKHTNKELINILVIAYLLIALSGSSNQKIVECWCNCFCSMIFGLREDSLQYIKYHHTFFPSKVMVLLKASEYQPKVILNLEKQYVPKVYRNVLWINAIIERFSGYQGNSIKTTIGYHPQGR